MLSFLATSRSSWSSTTCWALIDFPTATMRGSSDFSWAMLLAGISQSPASRTLITKSRSAGLTEPAPLALNEVAGTGIPVSARAGETGASSTVITIAEMPTNQRDSRRAKRAATIFQPPVISSFLGTLNSVAVIATGAAGVGRAVGIGGRRDRLRDGRQAGEVLGAVRLDDEPLAGDVLALPLA